MRIVSALCVHRNTIYRSIPGVECYDESRDVRTFDGSTPIVAHPPCRTWSAFCRHQAQAPPGEKELAPLCVEWLKQCGGVLEHPAHSRLWDELRLPMPGEPPRDGIVSIAINQSWFGMDTTKATWLLIGGVDIQEVDIPFRLFMPSGDRRRWQLKSKNQRSRTTMAFAEWLVSLARSSRVLQHEEQSCNTRSE